MSNARKLPLSLAALMMLIGAASCSEQQATVTTERLVAVETEVLKQTTEDVSRVFTGTVEGEQQADIFAKVSEVVEKIHVQEGAKVRTGQLLISLDKTGPSSTYRSAYSLFKNAEKNFKTMEYLFAEGAVSELQFDGARTEYEVYRAAFEAAASLVEIVSPIDGSVTALNVAAGDYLSQGQTLVTIATTDRLRVKFGVNAREIGLFREGAEVSVLAEDGSSPVAGRVAAVARSADPQTRAFQVEVLFDNTGDHFRPGMFVRVEIVVTHLVNVITVPRSAVLVLDDRESVFVVSDSVASRRQITLGEDLGGRVVVTSGLTAGDTLVTLGQTYLDDGFKVKLTNRETKPQ
ncbi:MAG: efflux RND transporter periplasmic adaptor subunit [bacterium]